MYDKSGAKLRLLPQSPAISLPSQELVMCCGPHLPKIVLGDRYVCQDRNKVGSKRTRALFLMAAVFCCHHHQLALYNWQCLHEALRSLSFYPIMSPTSLNDLSLEQTELDSHPQMIPRNGSCERNTSLKICLIGVFSTKKKIKRKLVGARIVF